MQKRTEVCVGGVGVGGGVVMERELRDGRGPFGCGRDGVIWDR